MNSNNCKNPDTRAGLLCSIMCLLTVISMDIDFLWFRYNAALSLTILKYDSWLELM